jgi:hypothetical protein
MTPFFSTWLLGFSLVNSKQSRKPSATCQLDPHSGCDQKILARLILFIHQDRLDHLANSRKIHLAGKIAFQ